VSEYRAAVADLIRTPACDRRSLEHKKRYAKNKNLPISADDIAECIEADELFLANHRVAARTKSQSRLAHERDAPKEALLESSGNASAEASSMDKRLGALRSAPVGTLIEMQ
jgi:hypothetical protein